MPTPRQPLKQLKDEYDKWGILRELDLLHARVNDLYLTTTALSTSLVAADVDTAAEIATQLNATNTAINAILTKLRLQ